jgi:ABC-type transport system involved in multi-copper enzyme maturation permease subunit
VVASLLGPLAGPECRRALGRSWVLAVRWFAALPPTIVVLIVLWIWWFYQQISTNYTPVGATRVGLLTMEHMFVTCALVLAPALLAGTLAGEKMRGTLGLLLACLVSPLEIVVARLAGRLSVIAMFLLAGLPALVFCASIHELDLPILGLLMLLPLAVALGGGGLAIGISAVANRGRDALLAVYFLVLILLLAPLFASPLPTWVQDWLAPLNPYQGISPLVGEAEVLPALLSIGTWTLIGMACCAFGAWRLRPMFLRDTDGRPRRRRLFRRTLPPVGDRPMVWKELHVEQVKAFNRFVRWLSILVSAVYLGASLVLAGLVLYWRWVQYDPSNAEVWVAELRQWTASPAATVGVCWLIQWSMGLRAAVAIASERERNTWDALLISPLEGREIVLAKIYGSAYAWRGFVAAVFISWTLAIVCDAMTLGEYAILLADTLVVGIFMVVMGVWFSLCSPTATRAMTLTMVSWMGAAVAISVGAFISVVVLGLILFLLWMWWQSTIGPTAAGLAAAGPLIGTWFSISITIVQLLLYALAAVVVAAHCWHRFDQLAGRSFPTSPVAYRKRRRRLPTAVNAP